MTDGYDSYRAGPGDNLLAQIAETAREVQQKERFVEELEERLDEEKAALRRLTESALPKLMEAAETDKITTKDGIEIKIDENLRGSIPKANEEDAFEWLEGHGQGKIIKRQFTIEFGKGDEAWANKFEKDLGRRKKPLNVKRKKTVHPQTLLAMLREALANGEDIPLDTFGVFRQRVAKIKVKG